MISDSDKMTKFTAHDAFTCKHSAFINGYFSRSDEAVSDATGDLVCYSKLYGRHLAIMKLRLERERGVRFSKRLPLMHRGYFARMLSVDLTIRDYLSLTTDSNSSEAITRRLVYLGAGYDVHGISVLPLCDSLQVVEVDFPDVARHKFDIYRSDKEIASTLGLEGELSMEDVDSMSKSGIYYLGKRLILIGCDLRAPETLTVALSTALQCQEESKSLPSLVITECVLAYMTEKAGNDLVDCLASMPTLRPLSWCSYDMINPFDTYGRTMLSNLSKVGFDLPGFAEGNYSSSVESLQQRFLERSFSQVKAKSMLTVYNKVVPALLRANVVKRERLDEIEEWQMVMSHYALTLAVLDKGSDALSTSEPSSSSSLTISNLTDLLEADNSDPIVPLSLKVGY